MEILSILIIPFTWLGFETDWLRIRLPTGSTPWHDELPYEIGYLDSDFMDVEPTIWNHTEAQYRAWLKKRHEPKLKYGFVDHTVDYPQDRALAEIEDQDKRRAGEMIYQRR